ncbi:MAG: response regulator transcription factor [Pseudomonadota bacterium]
MNILLIEDDLDTAEFITRGLAEQGYAVQHEGDSPSGLLAAASGDFDVIVFDRLLPGMDGVDAVKLLRGSRLETPILMLTALDGIEDRVAGLEAGADDYMVKPFAFSELLARVRALARRKPMVQDELQLSAGDLLLNRATREVTRAGQPLDLLPREFQILELFLSHAGQVITRTMLLERVWGYTFDPKTSLVQTHVSRLRAKVDKPFAVELIRTVRGAGYMLSAEQDDV